MCGCYQQYVRVKPWFSVAARPSRIQENFWSWKKSQSTSLKRARSGMELGHNNLHRTTERKCVNMKCTFKGKLSSSVVGRRARITETYLTGKYAWSLPFKWARSDSELYHRDMLRSIDSVISMENTHRANLCESLW